jgi:NAD(P)-dependent dehydrogenase (short-subunit alcohol dehydrogenase family)
MFAIADINAGLAASVINKIEKLGAKAAAFELDATKPTAVKDCVEKILETFGTIDILVNCIGYNEFKDVDQTTNEFFTKLVEINLFSHWFFCKEVIPVMKSNKSGKIINISSAAGVLGIPNALPYTSSKHGLIGLTRALAIDLGPFNINVNCICPATIQTPLVEKSVNKEFLAKMTGRIPLRRLGKVSDIAKASLFLASSSSDWITGAVLPVDGGLTCCIRSQHME